MTPARKKRLTLISLIFATFAAAVALLLYAMQNDLNHYYSLQSVAEKAVPLEQPGIRVGGMVEERSLVREGDSLTVRFRITDFQHPSLTVTYTGILPDLFREKQGVIARGT
ncbi:MAG: cytochrome c maturation protein CcmE, partial [Cardiobacterium hominis]